MTVTHAVLSLLILISLAAATLSQQASHPGIELYLAGKYDEAVVSLSAATKQNDVRADANIWNYLGLSYAALKDFKNAKKAFEKTINIKPGESSYHSNLAFALIQAGDQNRAKSESKKAIELNPNNVIAYYIRGTINLREANLKAAENDADQIIRIDPAYAQGYLLKSNVLVADMGLKVSKGAEAKAAADLLRQAVQALKDGLEKCKNPPDKAPIQNELESVGTFYVYFSKEKPASILPDAVPEPGITPLKILKKPRPGYTDSARYANDQGTIKLAVIFGADGKVSHILPLKRLGHGLDEQAIMAARKIEFEPQKKDGKPVSVAKQIEYTFSIY